MFSRAPGNRIDRPRGGFALLVTIVLVAFLVLIITALAALTRVETQVAANSRHLDAARGHALMALNIAIGQLQQHAGHDSRLTAQANLLDADAANPWFTGVWTADASGSPTLRTWLVSGNETAPLRFGPDSPLGRETASPEIPLALDADGLATNGPDSANPNRVRLVGPATASTTGPRLANGSVVVPGVPLNAPAPGFAADRTVGRYAWWIGDQGVKASLALPDRADEVRYAPWFDPDPTTGHDQRARIRQQIATAPTFFRRLTGTEEYGFDPLDGANTPLLPRVLDRAHLDLLAPAVAGAPLDDFRRDQFHAFTDRAHAVLANTLPATSPRRGLQRDLSLAPDLLGPAFVALTDLAGHLEIPAADNAALPPVTSRDSPRRRHRITAPILSPATADDPAIEFKVAPVLTAFLLQFKVQSTSATNVEIRARQFVELWNPHTAALVPEDLRLEITGLPKLTITDANGDGASVEIDLQTPPSTLNAGAPENALLVRLPFAPNGNADRASWLPGRLYAWSIDTGPSPSADLRFYQKNLSAQGWPYLDAPLANTNPRLRVETGDSCTLTIRLKRADGTLLATYTSPTFEPFAIPDVEDPPSDDNWKFAFAFRLRQPSNLNLDRSWLVRPGEDFRASSPPAAIFGPFDELSGLDPDDYTDVPSTSDDVTNFLLFRRAGTGSSAATLRTTRSANLDLPVFELPRLPHLSVGELQHLLLPTERPFAAGNSRGGQANTWFDRFFFSGLTSGSTGPDLAAGQPLPNWNLQPLSTDIASAGALSSRHLLQAGGFNLNSALPDAWRAVLSAVRFSPAHSFQRAAIDNRSAITPYTGSQPDPASADPATADEIFNDTTLADNAASPANPVGGPAFFRFPQTAQETYYWENTAIEGAFRKQAYRQGVRAGDQPIDGSTLHTLTTTQIADLADAIVTRARVRAATAGPYRSLQDFLAPNPAWSDRNLLEQAIADTDINPASIAPPQADGTVPDLTDLGLTSLTLTSADIMTALAPWLRTRSDTFVIRTYGESLNPVTGDAESRAWCEATVQRFPDTLNPADNIAAPAATGHGRAFRITRFRWLPPSDI